MSQESDIEEFMRSKIWKGMVIFGMVVFLISACSRPSAIPTATTFATTTAEEPIYLSIIWHQHQPVYYKDPETGTYEKPWVRVHAAKDYVDMATMLKNYPNLHVTFNLTPSLIRQLDDFQAGAKDLYWVTAEVPANQLTDDQKQFLLDRFFDTNRKIIARFPRYQELLQKLEAKQTFSTQDFLFQVR
jgi:alpha-amylase/alpha-mannosidase (GH57 family)